MMKTCVSSNNFDDIVAKLQNTNAYVLTCRIIDTVCVLPPVIVLKFNDYTIQNLNRHSFPE